MYDAPSMPEIRKCVVSAETVRNRTRPLLVTESGQVVGDGSPDDGRPRDLRVRLTLRCRSTAAKWRGTSSNCS